MGFPQKKPHGREVFLAELAKEDPPRVRRRSSAQGELKERLLVERGALCQSCSIGLPERGMLHAHHVVPVSRGGTDADDNAALLCPNCHATAHYLDRQMHPTDRPVTWRSLVVLIRHALRLPNPT